MGSMRDFLVVLKSPNFLTITRIFVAPFVLFLCVFLPRHVLVFRLLSSGLFVAVALTDFLDGYLARKHNQVSKFGICFDNIADKVLVTFALLGALATKRVDVLPVAIIIVREISVSGMREFAAAHKAGSAPVTQLSKIKTAFQMTAITILLFSSGGDWAENLGSSFLWISAVLALITLYQHARVILANIDKKP